jgi:protein-disulfide isomerase
MKQKNILIAAAALLILVFGFGAVYFQNQKSEQAAQRLKENAVALVRTHSPTFGSPAAPVHIVEFLDPACGTCRDFYPLVKQMMAANPGKIRVSVRYAPFHPGSDQVVKVIEAARSQGLFKDTLETLFASQNQWVVNHAAQPDLVWPLLARTGLDLDRARIDMTRPEIAQLIQQDLADAKTLNVTMTPEFFVNGKPLPSFGFEELKKLVDEALVEASKK